MTAQHFLDPYDAILFDIDGTLLNAQDAVHYFAFCEALTCMAGRPLNLDGVVTHGNVDEGILRDALTLANVPESQWRPLLREACDGMCRYVAAHAEELKLDVLPGAPELLTHLKQQGKLLGTATGNLAGIGRTKLAQCGLLTFFDFGGFSDTCETRADVFAHAIRQAQSLTGPGAQLCVIGDTPADIRAGHAHNLPVVAVATGIYSFELLAEEQPELCLHSLRELLPTAV